MRKQSLRVPRAPGSTADAGPLEEAFAAIRDDLDVTTTYPAPALEEARRALSAAHWPSRDETDVPFFTIDPAGSMDLDQAMCLERRPGGYRVRYAIADVAAYVRPGGSLDAVTWQRGQTLYMPDLRRPLHPTLLSEDAVSLLPGRRRAAYVWDIDLDGDGRRTRAQVYRAIVRSRGRLDYEQVQAQVETSDPPQELALLREIGRLRIAREGERGGAGLPMPEQVIRPRGDGEYELTFRPLVPSEEWNAQISLLTGISAAELMLRAGVGILRTMPRPDDRDVERYRRQAAALSVPWPTEEDYGHFLARLDRADPRHLALIHDAVVLFRGAGYTPFDGTVPQQVDQAAVGAPYAHVTAPLRRLVDRFGLVICEAVSAGREVPHWARESLPRLPEVMARSDQLAGRIEHACTSAMEAAVLQAYVGQELEAMVIDVREGGSLVVRLADLAVMATVDGRAAPGDRVRVRVVSADVAERAVTLEMVARHRSIPAIADRERPGLEP